MNQKFLLWTRKPNTAFKFILIQGFLWMKKLLINRLQRPSTYYPLSNAKSNISRCLIILWIPFKSGFFFLRFEWKFSVWLKKLFLVRCLLKLYRPCWYRLHGQNQQLFLWISCVQLTIYTCVNSPHFILIRQLNYSFAKLYHKSSSSGRFSRISSWSR